MPGKILSVIIAHPLRKVCGATNAGRELTVATADLMNAGSSSPQLELAIMWDADEELTIGQLPVHHFRCTTMLGAAGNLLPRFLRVPLYDSRIPELIRDGGFDLVHLHNLVPSFAAERVARMCRRIGVPYIISTHGFNEASRYAKVNGFGAVKTAMAEVAIARPFRRVVRGATAFFALSNCELPMLAALGVPSENVHVVTNGVNEFYLDPPSSAEIEAAREKFHIGVEPVLFYMGSLHSYKGADVFLRSLPQIDKPFQAILAGGFKDPSEPGRMLQAAGIGAGLASAIQFTGSVSNEELRALYHLADLFVYPTQGDTLPLVVLEAMACGLPIVSTTVGGIPFAVTPDCGRLVRPGDSAAVAARVNELLRSPELRQHMGTASNDRVLRVFRWAASAQAAVLAYEQILGKAFPVKLHSSAQIGSHA